MKLKIFLLFLLFTISITAQSGLSPYPIIFIHGFNSNNDAWTDSNELDLFDYLDSWGLSSGVNINISLDFNRSTTSLKNTITEDVHLITNSIRGGDYYTINFDVHSDGIPLNNLKANDNLNSSISPLENSINIDDPSIFFVGDIIRIQNEFMIVESKNNNVITVQRGLFGSDIVYHDADVDVWNLSAESNQSAIAKQGWGLKLAIDLVKTATNCQKVILVGHSMGGLTAREYLRSYYYQDDVSKLVTIGTPHLGTTMVEFYDPINTSRGIDERSDAVRDVRYTYSNDSADPDPPFGSLPDDGVFLFGGPEDYPNIPEGFYYSSDFNADGDEIDFIEEGLSFDLSTLPSSVDYNWIISVFVEWLFNGDGVVRTNRQFPWQQFISGTSNPWIEVGDTLMTKGFHTSETTDYKALIRGLDEPDIYTLAYYLFPTNMSFSSFNRSIKGLITYQTNYAQLDFDYFRIEIPVAGDVNVSLSGNNTGMTQLAVRDAQDLTTIESISYPGTIPLHLTAGIYNIRVRGLASPVSWQNPYTLTVNYSAGAAPLTPILDHPLNGATNVSQSLTLLWDNPGGAETYNIQVATDQSFSNFILNESNYPFIGKFIDNLELNTTYFWRVMAVNYWGSSDWSEVWSFTTGSVLPIVYLNGSITENTVLTASNLYVVNPILTIEAGVTLTIEPGVIIKTTGSGLYGHSIDVNGTLIADGTPQNKIVFTSILDDKYGGDTNGDGDATQPSPGNWGGFLLYGSNSVVDNCIIQYNSYFQALGSSQQITGSIFRSSSSSSIFLTNSSTTINNNLIQELYCLSGSPIISGNTFEKGIIVGSEGDPIIQNNIFNTGDNFPIQLRSTVLTHPVIGNNLSGANIKLISMGSPNGGCTYTIDQHLLDNQSDLPYYLGGTLTVESGAILTIDPGVIIKTRVHDYYGTYGITINGVLIANGTPENKIVLTSVLDDSYGGDSNGDGDATQPYPGNWGFFSVYGSNSILNNCIVQYNQFHLAGPSQQITNSIFRFSSGSSISVNNSSTTISNNIIQSVGCSAGSPVINGNTFEEGITVSSEGDPIIQNNIFNTGYNFPIQLIGSTVLTHPVIGNDLSGANIKLISMVGYAFSYYMTYSTDKHLLANQSDLPYLLKSILTIDSDATLTIDPGVIIKIREPQPQYDFGMTVNGRLIADGTPENKIVFTSILDDSYGGDSNGDDNATQPYAGAWRSLFITSSNSILDNCLIQYGGSWASSQGMLNIYDGTNIQITNNTFRQSYYAEIKVSGISSVVEITGNKFEYSSGAYGDGAITIGNISYALIQSNQFNYNGTSIVSYTDSISILDNYFENNSSPISITNFRYLNINGNTGIHNTYNGIIIAGPPEVGAYSYLPNNAGLPYIIPGNLTIEPSTNLEIEPGTVIKFEVTTWNNEHWLLVNGLLIADGTPENKIVFTSIRDDSYGGDTNNDGDATQPYPGIWGPLSVYGSNSILDNCVIQYGGGQGMLYVTDGSSIQVSNNTLRYSGGYGLYLKNCSPIVSNNSIDNAVNCQSASPLLIGNTIGEGIVAISGDPTIQNNTFNTGDSYPIQIGSNVLTHPVTGNILSGANKKYIGIDGSYTIDKHLLANQSDLPYNLMSTLTIEPGVTFTIDQGVVIKAEVSNSFPIDIIVNGTLIADGTPENKIVFTSILDDSYGGDSNGDGDATRPYPGSWWGSITLQGSNSLLDNCVIQYGGYSMIRSVNGTSQQMTNNIIRYAGGIGLDISNSNPTVNNNIFINNGIQIFPHGSPYFSNNAFINTNSAIYNSSNTLTVNAQNNYWGGDLGPIDNSDDRSTGGFYNPTGNGDPVSDYVDYSNWLDSYDNLLLKTITNIVPEGNGVQTDFGITNLSFKCNSSNTADVTVANILFSPGLRQPLPAGTDSVSRFYWIVRNHGLNFTNGIISIPISILGGNIDPNHLVWLKRDNINSVWQNLGGIVEGGNLLNTQSFNSFSEFAIGYSQNPNPMTANLKVFLQGNYSSGTMNTSLNTLGVIPLSQPFNGVPWNYAGTENVTGIPAGVVDWTLLELRTGITMDTRVSQRARFIKSDGSIVDLDGVSPVKFGGVDAGSYYLVVHHRDHLSIMSSTPLSFTLGETTNYDFTDSQTKAYTTGPNPMSNLGGGKYGMIAGDADADGIVDYEEDLLIKWIPNFGLDGYYPADFNMNGTVDYESDVLQMWLSNFGYSSQVPGVVLNAKKLELRINIKKNNQ